MNLPRLALPPSAAERLAPLRARWVAMAPRERNLATLAAVVVLLFLLWLVLVAPALRTMREAPAKLDQLDRNVQTMQRLAGEARELHNVAPLSGAQAALALQAATAHLGDQRAKLAVQGDRAVLTLTGVSGEQLRGWLNEARSAARARPVEAQLDRTPQGYTGSLVVQLGSSAP